MIEIILTVVAIVVSTILLVMALQSLPTTRLYKKTPYLLDMGFIRARIDIGTRVFMTILVGLSPFYFMFMTELTAISIVLPLIVTPLCAALFLNPELQRIDQASLVVTKPLLSTVATVHLRNAYQPFDRETYAELMQLVRVLPSKGIPRITLTSPMFYKSNDELRDFSTLEKQLLRHNATLIHGPAKRFDCILGKIAIFLAANKYSGTTWHKIDTQRWHIIHIDSQAAA